MSSTRLRLKSWAIAAISTLPLFVTPAVYAGAAPGAAPAATPVPAAPAAPTSVRTSTPIVPAAIPARGVAPAVSPARNVGAVNRTIEATLQQMRACQNQAASRFTGILRDQVATNTVRVGSDNSASVRWQFPNGTYGFCRLSATAEIQEFGVYPGVWDSSNQRVARDIQPREVCQRRLLQEFPDAKAENVTLNEMGRSQDGATAFRWQLKDGDAGFCSVNEEGGVFEFAVRM